MAGILIVDDDPRIAATLAKLLRVKGHATRIASNGAAALLAVHETPPDLILMDLAMPILGGHEAIEALRRDEQTAAIPVVVVSGMDDVQTMTDALLAGANVFLTKPIDAGELVALIERLLAKPTTI